MAMDPSVKKNWAENQKKHAYPVNALGLRISPKDKGILKIWKDEGIDQYVKGSGGTSS